MLDQTNSLANLMADKPRELTSVGNAIPMPLALGATTKTGIEDFDRLWKAPDTGMGNKAAVWDGLVQAAKDKAGVTRLELALAAKLVDSLVTDFQPDPTNLANAGKILAVVFAANPPPSEAQFVQLLNRDLPKKGRADAK